MNEDKIINKLLEHDDRFEQLKTKIFDTKKEILDSMLETEDRLAKMLIKNEQEDMAVKEGLRRHEDKLDNHEERLNQLQPQFQT